ncbi:MAG: hypothetical protein K2P81_08675 [Bacteriovoracaceae bacterium]|nr:hypothetical protein [Bacteriovoracaceae bacterium]
MSKILPRTSDLRRGKFKKRLVSQDELKIEGPKVAQALRNLQSKLETQSVSPALYAALWTITYLRIRHPFGWWGAHRKDAVCPHNFDLKWSELPYFDWSPEELKILERYPTLGELLSHRAFRATPESVHRALLSWSTGGYPLVLMDRIPSVAEVLEQQTKGKRCVTLFHQEAQLSKYILGERDPLGFGFHDLIHADHFFHQNGLMLGQIGFYRQIAAIHKEGLLNDWMKLEDYPHRLEYLMADMNSHPLHLWKCFKAICHMTRTPETVALFEETLPSFLRLSKEESLSLKLMNGQDFQIERHGVSITQFCENWGL